MADKFRQLNFCCKKEDDELIAFVRNHESGVKTNTDAIRAALKSYREHHLELKALRLVVEQQAEALAILKQMKEALNV